MVLQLMMWLKLLGRNIWAYNGDIMWLAGGLELFLFFHILGLIIPTDELIFFRVVGIPPTRWIYHGYNGYNGIAFVDGGFMGVTFHTTSLCRPRNPTR
jgi:hypothetical protein